MNDFWNDRYKSADYVYGTRPNEFLAEQLAVHQSGGRALLAAEGEGRNAVYAAETGLLVDAFDLSVEGQRKAVRLAGERGVSLRYQVGDFRELDYEPATFDVLALIYAHFPPADKETFNRQLATYLKPGGLVIFEAFGSRHLPLRAANPAVGGPGSADMLFSEAEIRRTFLNFEVLLLGEEEADLNEGIYHRGRGSVVRFVGRKE